MAVSRQTAERMLEVLRLYVDEVRIGKLIEDLREVPGNQSFRETLALLAALWKKQQ